MLVLILALTLAGTAANYLFIDMAVHNKKHLFIYFYFYFFVLLVCLILLAIISSLSSYQISKISNNLTRKFKHDYKLNKKIAIKENTLINKLSIDYNDSVHLDRPTIYNDSKKKEKISKKIIRKRKKRNFKLMPLTKFYLTIFYSLFFLSILFNTFLVCVIIKTKFDYLLLAIYAMVFLIFIAQCISIFKLIDNMYNYDHLKQYREENNENGKEG
jgi:cell division septal protein FtsQ